MPEKLLLLLNPALAVGLTILGFLARDWFKTRTSGDLMTKTDCKECRDRLEKELAAGDVSFRDLRNDISVVRSAMVGIVLALIPICETVTEGKVDCSELRRIARTLAE